MVDQDRADAATDDALAVAEEVAAREAEAEAASDAPGDQVESPKVVRPRTRTSTRAEQPKPAVAETGDQDVAKNPAASATLVKTSPPSPLLSGEVVDSLSLTGPGAAVVNAKTVDVSRGGIGRVRAVDVAVSQGGIGLAQGDRISVEMGGIGAALGAEVRVTQGAVNAIVARDVRIEQAGVRTMIANNVHVERTTGVLVMIARHVEGDVRTLLDWRGAIAFGAAFGLVVSLFRRRR
jgi:hypothetical protein